MQNYVFSFIGNAFSSLRNPCSVNSGKHVQFDRNMHSIHKQPPFKHSINTKNKESKPTVGLLCCQIPVYSSIMTVISRADNANNYASPAKGQTPPLV